MNKFKPNRPQSIKNWVMIDYGDIDNSGHNWYGLKCKDGLVRGIPESTVLCWRRLIECMRRGESYYEKRLAWDPGTKQIISPRNTKEGEEFNVAISADEMATHLEKLLSSSMTWEALEKLVDKQNSKTCGPITTEDRDGNPCEAICVGCGKSADLCNGKEK